MEMLVSRLWRGWGLKKQYHVGFCLLLRDNNSFRCKTKDSLFDKRCLEIKLLVPV
jgi:hypothetical protein